MFAAPLLVLELRAAVLAHELQVQPSPVDDVRPVEPLVSDDKAMRGAVVAHARRVLFVELVARVLARELEGDVEADIGEPHLPIRFSASALIMLYASAMPPVFPPLKPSGSHCASMASQAAIPASR